MVEPGPSPYMPPGRKFLLGIFCWAIALTRLTIIRAFHSFCADPLPSPSPSPSPPSFSPPPPLLLFSRPRLPLRRDRLETRS